MESKTEDMRLDAAAYNQLLEMRNILLKYSYLIYPETKELDNLAVFGEELEAMRQLVISAQLGDVTVERMNEALEQLWQISKGVVVTYQRTIGMLEAEKDKAAALSRQINELK